MKLPLLPSIVPDGVSPSVNCAVVEPAVNESSCALRLVTVLFSVVTVLPTVVSVLPCVACVDAIPFTVLVRPLIVVFVVFKESIMAVTVVLRPFNAALRVAIELVSLLTVLVSAFSVVVRPESELLIDAKVEAKSLTSEI